MTNLLYPSETPLDFIKECRAIYGGQLSTSSSKDSAFVRRLKTLRKTNANPSITTTLRFILWIHEPENQKNVIPLLKGCDILALEDCRDTVFKTKKEINTESAALKELYRTITTIFDNPTTTDKQKMNLLRKHELFYPVSEKIFESCVGKVSRVAKLDIGPSEAGKLAILDQKVVDLKKEFEVVLSSPANSWGSMIKRALAVSVASLKVSLYREKIVCRQLERLVQENPGKTIAVLVGRSHHSLIRQVGTDKAQVQRFFIRDETSEEFSAQRKQWISNILVSMDALRIGYQPTYELDQIILYEIVSRYGQYEMLSPLGLLGTQQRDSLLNKLQKIWQKSIPHNQLNTDENIQKRIQATRQLLKLILSVEN